ncbi:MAG: toxin TumE [Planktothrix sp.]
MLPNILSDYLAQIEQAILQYRNIYVERYEEEILTPKRANLRIRLRFNQTYLLEINEAIIITDNQLEFLDYRYHFQDENNCLIFRYDSTPHFPNLQNFPHHKHLQNDVIASEKPEITQVLKEVNQMFP